MAYLEVKVHDALFVYVIESIQNLSHVVDSFGLIEEVLSNDVIKQLTAMEAAWGGWKE